MSRKNIFIIILFFTLPAIHYSLFTNKAYAWPGQKPEVKKSSYEKKAEKIEKDLKTLCSDIAKEAKKNAELEAEIKKLAAEAKSAGQLQKEAEEARELALKREKATREKAEREKNRASEEIENLKKKFKEERVDMYFNMAVILDKNDMHKDAEKEYLKALKVDSEDAGVHYNLAILYDDELNQNDKAITHYREYLRLRPDEKDVAQVKEWILRAEQEMRIGIELK